jgi:zinc transport system ATP-binding protein
MDKPILSVKDLNVQFNSHKILEDISFEVKRDDTLAIIGPNGAGKTVLFKCLLGLLPYTGKIEWAPDAKIGYVPQRLYVGKDLPLTVEEFLHFKEKDTKKIEEILEQVGFSEDENHAKHRGKRLLSSKLGVLSGGEFQRVVIAFALLGKRNVLLFDEPTSGVDVSAELTVYSLIEKLKKESDLTIIFISHELQVVYQHAASVLCLNKEKVCFGPPRNVIDKKSLQKLYGGDVHFHHHKDHY